VRKIHVKIYSQEVRGCGGNWERGDRGGEYVHSKAHPVAALAVEEVYLKVWFENYPDDKARVRMKVIAFYYDTRRNKETRATLKTRLV
jgi:hypothetical protein